jgi:hypothetical protein
MDLARRKCPSCGSRDIHGAKFGFGASGSICEFYCRACGLAEWKNNRDEDFGEWNARWWGRAESRASDKPKARKAAKSRASTRPKAASPSPPVQPVQEPAPITEPVLKSESDKDVLCWPQQEPAIGIWKHISELDPASLKHETLEVRDGRQLLVTAKLDPNRRSVVELVVHQDYFPSDTDFRDWPELFRFQALKKLGFQLFCQWISVPVLPEGVWPRLEEVEIDLYAVHGYHNMIGLEDQELQKLLPRATIRTSVDGPAWP